MRRDLVPQIREKVLALLGSKEGVTVAVVGDNLLQLSVDSKISPKGEEIVVIEHPNNVIPQFKAELGFSP